MNQPVINSKSLSVAANLQPRNAPYRGGMIAALDIGTSKVTCFIAERVTSDNPDGNLMRLSGVGCQASRGLRDGVVVNMEAAEQSIRNAIDVAERMANTTVKSVTVGISAARLESHTYNTRFALNGYAVQDEQMRELLLTVRDKYQTAEVELLHAIPVSYHVDDSYNVDDPRGMYGDNLLVTAHAITAPVGPVRNLLACLENCHLSVDTLVATPYASALASMVEDEMDLGALSIDMGGGTTSFTIFHEGVPVHTGAVKIGGNQITSDIAHGLSVSLATAERIKTLYGCALAETADRDEQFDVSLIGESGEESIQKIQKSDLTRIIRPRITETFELLMHELDRSNLAQLAGRRAVLTGGGALLSGARELAQHMLEKQVRIGQPTRLTGLPEAMSGPAFSACAGLVAYKRRQKAEELFTPTGKPSMLGRVGQWLKRNF